MRIPGRHTRRGTVRAPAPGGSFWRFRGARRSVRLLAGPVLAVGLCAALAAPAQALDDGTYLIKDATGGRCLAGARLAACGTAGTQWSLRNQDDGTVQFVEGNGKRRCLALPVAVSYPAALLLNACGPTSDRWRIEGADDGPVTIAHAYPPTGRLTVENLTVHVSNNSSVTWVLQRVSG